MADAEYARFSPQFHFKIKPSSGCGSPRRWSSLVLGSGSADLPSEPQEACCQSRRASSHAGTLSGSKDFCSCGKFRFSAVNHVCVKVESEREEATSMRQQGRSPIAGNESVFLQAPAFCLLLPLLSASSGLPSLAKHRSREPCWFPASRLVVWPLVKLLLTFQLQPAEDFSMTEGHSADTQPLSF
ncbi:hypothetical protein AAFF_G00259550 [Aldrovandia affinis]|uniref:Uncharacterized protein n=1 Tax=Aldrovandia affinis TaxID=143900 RepID=A0AAD7RC18_9TELE|nr:hypothetical protein AAFF_G00259550 [Aldrovandia affinis]